jgi:hypothetical protein
MMAQIIQFPGNSKAKKGNAALSIEGELKYDIDPHAALFEARMTRIKHSLNKINQLMADLKGSNKNVKD